MKTYIHIPKEAFNKLFDAVPPLKRYAETFNGKPVITLSNGARGEIAFIKQESLEERLSAIEEGLKKYAELSTLPGESEKH